MKSKILSPELSQLVFDVYMTPQQFAELITTYHESEITLIVEPPKE